jgi:ABC-type Fe3+/spermidine/putrescine transport system ATPase subunit
MALLSIRDVSKVFASTRVLDRITLEIGESEFVTVLGESGSGKTTLLRIIAGFEQADAGEVWMRGERIDRLPPNRRNVNTVFQHYALFPHMSVFENVAYGLRAKRIARSEIVSRAESTLKQMRMSDFSPRRPAQLSGGQQQRVALARALVNRPDLLLLDEPLSALDANLRRQMQLELKTLQREVGITFLFVTHDQEEAMTLSDRIVLLRGGGVEQVDTPREIYDRPRTAYVASFVGQTNLLRPQVDQNVARIAGLAWPHVSDRKETVFSLRPEHIRLVNETDPIPSDSVRCQGLVKRHIFAGSSELIEVDCGGELKLNVRVANQIFTAPQVTLEFAVDRLVPVTDN